MTIPNKLFQVMSSNVISCVSIFPLIYSFIFQSSLEILADRLNITPPSTKYYTTTYFINNLFGEIPYPWIFNLNLLCQIECVLFVCFCVVGIVTLFCLQSKALLFSFLFEIESS